MNDDTYNSLKSIVYFLESWRLKNSKFMKTNFSKEQDLYMNILSKAFNYLL